MKKLFITLLILGTLAVNVALAKSFVDEIEGIVGATPEVNINLRAGLVKMLMAFSGDEDAKEMREVMSGLDKIRISVFELNNDNNIKKLSNSIKKKVENLTSKGYESLVTVKDGNETVNILAKINDQRLIDAMIVVMEEDELVIISLDGEVDLQQLSEITEHFDVDIEDALDI